LFWIRRRRAQLGREADELGWVINDNNKSCAKVLGDLQRADSHEERQVQTIRGNNNVHEKKLWDLQKRRTLLQILMNRRHILKNPVAPTSGWDSLVTSRAHVLSALAVCKPRFRDKGSSAILEVKPLEIRIQILIDESSKSILGDEATEDLQMRLSNNWKRWKSRKGAVVPPRASKTKGTLTMETNTWAAH
jgi:hypothetical protein